MPDAPDLRTAAQAINEIIQREWPVVDFRGRQDELEALRAALAVEATEPPPDEWVTRYLVKDGGDMHQLWAIDTDADGYFPPPIECRIRTSDLPEVDDDY